MDYNCDAIDDRSTQKWQCFIWVCFVFALLLLTRAINYYRTEFLGRGFYQMVFLSFIYFELQILLV